jgi:hypothetical protein
MLLVGRSEIQLRKTPTEKEFLGTIETVVKYANDDLCLSCFITDDKLG